MNITTAASMTARQICTDSGVVLPQHGAAYGSRATKRDAPAGQPYHGPRGHHSLGQADATRYALSGTCSALTASGMLSGLGLRGSPLDRRRRSSAPSRYSRTSAGTGRKLLLRWLNMRSPARG